MSHFDLAKLEKEEKELEFKMQETDFWNDINKAQEITQLSKRIKEKINNYKALVGRIEDVEVLRDIMEEDDMETANEIIAEINDIDKIVNALRVETLLSGEYDKNTGEFH